MDRSLRTGLDPRRSFAARIGLAIIVLVSLGLVATSLVTLTIVRTRVTTQVQSNFQAQAGGLQQLVALFLAEKATELLVLGESDTIQTAAAARNASYGPNDESLPEVQRLDKHWLKASNDDPLIRSVTSRDRTVNAAAPSLTRFLDSFEAHGEVFVTDRLGGTIAATGRLSDYYQADEGWWTAAWNGGAGAVYISPPKYDESAHITALQIAVPVRNRESNQPIGVLRSTLDVSSLFQMLERVRTGDSGYAVLTDASGKILFDALADNAGMTVLPPSLLTATRSESLGSFADSDAIWGYAQITAPGSPKAAATEAEVNRAVGALGWVAVYRQDAREALAILGDITVGAAVVGSVAALAAAVAAIVLARVLTGRLLALTAVARQIGAGDLDAKPPRMSGSDEISVLAATFSSMTLRLTDMIASVRARSTELASTNERLEAALLAADIGQKDAERARELDRMKSEFVGLASHELRTPLTGIYGFSELLRESPLLPATEHGWAAAINDEAARLRDIIEGLLNVSRIESGAFTVALAPVSLSDCVQIALRALSDLVTERYPIRIDVAPDLWVVADRLRLVEVVENLVSNAIRYSPDGGAIEIAASGSGHEVRLTVVDHGLGIPDEALATLFERFKRIDTPDRAQIRGTGLGLYLVKHYVHSFDGRIDVSSVPGAGSTFSVTLRQEVDGRLQAA